MNFFFRWYDFWVGAYVDWERRVLYVCPLPMVGFWIRLPHDHDSVRGAGEIDGRWFCAICGIELEPPPRCRCGLVSALSSVEKCPVCGDRRPKSTKAKALPGNK